MSRKSTGSFQQQELQERLRRLEREIAELKAASAKNRAKQKTQEATSEKPSPEATGSTPKPKSS